MKQRNKRILQIVLMCLGVSLIPVTAQAPENYIIALWSFDQTVRYESEKQLNADFNRQPLPATLTMIEGKIDREGDPGVAFTDNTCGLQYDATLALRWDEVQGEDNEDPDDDARLRLTVSTVDWQNLALRFTYRTDRVKSFDVSYHLGDEQWVRIADDVIIDDNDSWGSIDVGLQEVDDIENREKVIFLIHDMVGEFTDGKLRIDNVVLLGERISSPIDCPPELQAVNPTQDISILLNSNNIPTFTGDRGFQFLVTDDKTPFTDMTIMALTSDPNVINQLGLTVIDADKGIFQLDIGAPHGYTGVADITLQVLDKSGNVTERVIQYGVSDVEMLENRIYHQGTASASAGVALDDSHMIVANDNNQTLYVYQRNQSGLPIASLDVTNLLNLPNQRPNGSYPSVDIEAGTKIGNRQFWLASHSNSDSGQRQNNRHRLFVTETQGEGDNITITYIGQYENLFNDLVRRSNIPGYSVPNVITNEIPPNQPDGLNIEGFTIAPDGQTAYIGFRTPLLSRDAQIKSIIVPIVNFSAAFGDVIASEAIVLGDTIELDLDGLGIRGLECNANGCVIIAGSIDDANVFALYTWSGNANDAPVFQSVNLTGLTPESVILGDSDNLAGGTTIQLLSDNGRTDWYHTGTNTTGLNTNLRFFQSDIIVLD